MQPSLFMPLATRLPKQRVKVQVVSLSPGCVRAAILRQHGVPVHDVPFSRTRFAMNGFRDLMNAVHAFRPDVVQAWGHTAQLVSITVRKRCDWSPAVIWSIVDTAPLAKDAGFVDRQKLKMVAKDAGRADRIVYASEAAAVHHRRAGFPEEGYACISPGVDAARFKPDPAARSKVRERLQVPHDAFVIAMVAPFQPEYDHATFLKGVAELIKTHPSLYVLLAGHGVQRGNAALMAMIGSGALSTRIQLLGEWSDLTSLFNACDLVCSSALTDSARMTLAMAMLCGIPCVATGLGAQGELIAQHGVAIEPGNPAAFVRGIGKILQLSSDKRHHLAHGARKHALQNYVYVRSLQKYLQLYGELVGKEAFVQAVIPAPEVEVKEPLPPKVEAPPPPPKKPAIVIEQLADPDSLETRVQPVEPESLPKWRIEQEQARAEQDARWSTNKSSDGDVLQMFEMELAANPAPAAVTPMSERARGFVEDFEELLPVEALTVPATSLTPDAKDDAKPQAESAAASIAEPVEAADTEPVKAADTEPPKTADAESSPAAAAEGVKTVPETASSKAPESAAASESTSRSEEALAATVVLDATNSPPPKSEEEIDQLAQTDISNAVKVAEPDASALTIAETIADKSTDTSADTSAEKAESSGTASAAVDTNATLPPMQTLAALEASTSAPSAEGDMQEEPVQASLFDFDVVPEPERKVGSG